MVVDDANFSESTGERQEVHELNILGRDEIVELDFENVPCSIAACLPFHLPMPDI